MKRDGLRSLSCPERLEVFVTPDQPLGCPNHRSHVGISAHAISNSQTPDVMYRQGGWYICLQWQQEMVAGLACLNLMVVLGMSCMPMLPQSRWQQCQSCKGVAINTTVFLSQLHSNDSLGAQVALWMKEDFHC